jgi:two-component sensor histidine kinase
MHILLIEDDDDFARSVVELFSAENHSVTWTEHFIDFAEALESRKWDIILSDIHMDFLPEQIIQKVSECEINGGTPMIFLTAERETNLATKIINDEEYPVISKFEIETEMLRVVLNYNEICNLVKANSGELHSSNFHRFITRYINDKRYSDEGLKQTLPGWINQLKSTVSKQKTNQNYTSDINSSLNRSVLKMAFIQIESSEFRIKHISSATKRFVNNTDVIGSIVTDVFPFSKPNKIASLLKEVAKYGKQVESCEILLRLDGKNQSYLMNITPLIGVEDHLIELELFDNSSQVHLIEFLNLKETNTLLIQEIHHRVNNNLNLILSLINLKLLTTNSSGVDACNKILNKIIVISAVYKNISQSDSISSISLREYVIDVFSQLGINEDFNRKILIDEIQLNINQAIPLGLLLNEIIETSKETGLPIRLKISEESSIICVKIKGEDISTTFSAINSKENNFQSHLTESLLRSLDAIIANHGKDEVQIRFKKLPNKGIGSNLYE